MPVRARFSKRCTVPVMTDMTTPTLRGLRVLITRPAAQTTNWQQLLTAAGAKTVSTPLLRIVPIGADQAADYQAIKNIVMDISRYQHGIFVSKNAAQIGLEWLEQYWPQMPLGLHFYAVGSATGNYLAEAGYRATVATGSMNTEALLEIWPEPDMSGQRVVIFRGRGGRPLMAETLRQRGAQVDFCEMYERHFPADGVLDTLRAESWGQTGDVVTVHSGETLSNWHAIVDASGQMGWKQLPLLVPGERVAQLARQLGFTQIVTSENASDACMLDTLLNWRARQNR